MIPGDLFKFVTDHGNDVHPQREIELNVKSDGQTRSMITPIGNRTYLLVSVIPPSPRKPCDYTFVWFSDGKFHQATSNELYHNCVTMKVCST